MINLEIFTDLWYNETKKGGERMNFLHCDRDENMFSLHDCITDRVYFQDKELIFDFPDGFGVLPNHPANDIDKVVRTDAAKVTYTLIDDEYDVTLYVFEKSFSDKRYERNGASENSQARSTAENAN